MRNGFKSVAVAACATALAGVMAFAMVGCSGGSSSSSNASSSGNDVAPVTESSSSSSSAGSSGSEAPNDGSQISVNVTMQESITKATDVDTPFQFSDENITVSVAQDATALDALEATGREIKTSGSGDSVEVTAIGDLAAGAYDGKGHWQFSVNGEVVTASPAVYTLSDGDAVVFDFVE